MWGDILIVVLIPLMIREVEHLFIYLLTICMPSLEKCFFKSFVVVQLCLTLCYPMDCSTPGFPALTSSWSLLKLMSSSAGKDSTCNAGDPSSIPGSERSTGEGKGYLLLYSGLENSLDWGAWQATVHGVTKSRTRRSNFHLHIESVMSSNHLILCHPLLLSSIFPSIRVFSSESTLHIRWPKYWSFSFSISPSNEYSELISFRRDWFDLLAVQGTLKSLLQHHSLKASTLQHSVFLIVQLSHLYMTTGKIIALTIQAFVGNVSVF